MSAAINVGLDQLARGEVIDYDDPTLHTLAADVKAKGRKRLGGRRDRARKTSTPFKQSRSALDDIQSPVSQMASTVRCRATIPANV